MKLSILIPAKNEEYLKETVEDALKHITDDTEIIVGLDGWECELPDDPRVKITIFPTTLGQRAMTNVLARKSEAKYLMKIDAHCSFSQGFDTKMLEDMQDDWTLVPVLLNLRPYHFKCEKGHIFYLGNKTPEKCLWCDSKKMERHFMWEIVPKPICSSFYLDRNLIFQYCPVQSTDLLNETMAIQGSGFMLSREKYWELDICGEEYGSWGSQGAEVGLKTWLSGGTVMCTKKAYMGHWFRQSDEFPYQRDMKQVDHAHNHVKDMFLNNKWPKQKRTMEWLVEKFNYPGDWNLTENK